MSFKIFTLQLFGKLKPVEVIEKKRKMLFDDYLEFQRVENSEELTKYLALDKEINSAEFKKLKTETEALHFKGSKEFNLLKEFGKLQKNGHLKDYFKLKQSGDVEKYERLKISEKLTGFYDLKKYVTEGQFAKDRSELLKQIFKGSAEEKQLHQFIKLEKSRGIRTYIELHQTELLKKLETDPKSKKLKLYRETLNSQQLAKYLELKALVNSESFKKREAFLRDKTKFENSDAHKKQLKYKQLAADSDIRFFLKFEKSSLYKNYLKMDVSVELKRHNELKEMTNSNEFRARKAYLEDNKKWEKTDEYKREQEYIEMKKLAHLVKYFNYKGTPVFDFFNEWEVSFEDQFQAKMPDAEKWATMPYLSEKLLGDNYAVAGDLHVFTNGKNLKTNGKLAIEVKKEKVQCKVWQMPAGFVPYTLEYSSGMVSSWKSFWQEDGIYEAKIRFVPCRQIVSSVFLSGEENTPRVNLLEMGAQNRVGFLHRTHNGKVTVNGLDITNLKQGNWYIFSVVKKGSNFTWKINESEILSLSSGDFNRKLNVSASSIVINEISSSQLPSAFEIEWVRCYRKK